MRRPLDSTSVTDPDAYCADKLSVVTGVLPAIRVLTTNAAAASESIADEQDGAGNTEKPTAALQS